MLNGELKEIPVKNPKAVGSAITVVENELFGVHEFSDFCVRSETVRNRLFGVNEKRSE
jgi:hypothetical protein